MESLKVSLLNKLRKSCLIFIGKDLQMKETTEHGTKRITKDVTRG